MQAQGVTLLTGSKGPAPLCKPRVVLWQSKTSTLFKCRWCSSNQRPTPSSSPAAALVVKDQGWLSRTSTLFKSRCFCGSQRPTPCTSPGTALAIKDQHCSSPGAALVVKDQYLLQVQVLRWQSKTNTLFKSRCCSGGQGPACIMQGPGGEVGCLESIQIATKCKKYS